MKKIALFSIFSIFATLSFAQEETRNAEISELAKQKVKAYYECPSLDLLDAFTQDFIDKKIDFEEYKESGKIAVAQIADCTRPYHKKLHEMSLTQEEYEFYLQE